MNDPIKRAISTAVAEAVYRDEFRNTVVERSIDIGDIEVNEIAPTESMIRVTPARRDGGMPRYFRVKVSEVM